MWFKNLRLYRFTASMDLSAETLAEHLQKHPFHSCGSTEFYSYGWTPPLGKHSEQLTHATGDFIMFSARKQEKVLPPAAINEKLEEKILALESAEAREVYRKEKRQFKEEITHTLLPQALTRSFRTFAYIDTKEDMLVIDAASDNKAEELLELLRASLSTLPVVPLQSQSDIAAVMTRWLTQRIPDSLDMDGDCELQNPNDSKNIVRCKNQELESSEVLNHIKAGKRVTQLAVIWKQAIRLVIGHDFSIKGLRFEEIIQDQATTEYHDPATQFDQDFAVMSLQLRECILWLIDEFGGVQQDS